MSILTGRPAQLLRRELWEHRALWLAPVVIAAVALVTTLISNGGGPWNASPQGGMVIQENAPVMAQEMMGRGVMIMLFVALGGVACITTFAYLLDCLYAERKDRSILFWKSLPVSDQQTVLAKVVAAMLVVPVLVLVLATLLQPLVAGIAYLRFPELRPLFGGFVSGLAAWPYVTVAGLFGLLWFLPVATYLMLASVLAKRAPLVYAVIPPLALGIAERLFLDTHYVHRFLGERLFPWPSRVQFLFGDTPSGFKTVGGEWWMLFQDPKLWLGLVAAAGMMYLVVRLRRYRDDT